MDEKGQKVYELSFLLTPLLTPEDAADLVTTKLAKQITSLGGAVTSHWPLQLITLAYPIGKVLNHKRDVYREAHFGAVRFTLAAENVAELEQKVRAQTEVIRQMIIANVTPEMSLPKVEVPMGVVGETVAPSAEAPALEVVKPVVNEAEIDKEIDSLLAKVD